MVHAFFNPTQAATFNEVAPRKDSTFEVSYFGIHGLAHTVRTILAVSGAKFTSYVPEDWASEKPKKPFGVIPTLKETSVDGKVKKEPKKNSRYSLSTCRALILTDILLRISCL